MSKKVLPGVAGLPPLTQVPGTGTRVGHGRLAHGRLHLLLTLDSLVVVLISVNRKAGGTLAFVADDQFLRWVEVNNMVLGLCTVLLYHLVAVHLVNDSPHRRRGAPLALGVLFTAGAYVYALSLGDHEITNYLHGRFCSESLPTICRVVAFNDDVFSDVVFLAGFTLLNTTLMVTQLLFPTDRAPRPWDNVLITVNALFIGAGITANLAFEKAGFDPFVVGATAVFALVLLRVSPRQPVLLAPLFAHLAEWATTNLNKVERARDDYETDSAR
ncbi:hypothetical protein [Streptomyces brasiliensis]|uniref:hypothetical protein n=1 Tax=Streptomyces brasiliensis TaxID=1954 RepID=UPI0027E3FC8F|nr:hypothetical protein [Streptomyces brasiliensis]